MSHYVVGFLFEDRTFDKVVLILKNKPAFQAGKMNGVGGGVERGEHPDVAMRREFLEETGYDQATWHRFATLDTTAMDRIDFYRARASDLNSLVRTTTDEEVLVCHVEDILCAGWTEPTITGIMPNVPWLVTMALSMYRGERSRVFHITESATNE